MTPTRMIDTLTRSGIVRWGVPLVTVAIAVVSGVVFGIEVAFLVLAAGALVGVIALFWSSVQSLTGESPLTFEEALSMGAPSAEEEQKRAVLRALKDLEYERSVGKISVEDYRHYSARYREEAKRLIQAVDESLNPARKQVEELLRERLASQVKEESEPVEPEKTAAEAPPSDREHRGAVSAAAPKDEA